METVVQNPMISFAIYSLLLVGFLLIFTGGAQLVSRRESRNEVKNRRLKMISQNKSNEEVLAILKPPANSGWKANLPFVGDLPKTLKQAGLTIRPGTFLMLCAAAFVILLIGALNVFDPLRSVMLAFGLGLFLPLVVIRHRKEKYEKALVEQLP